MDLIDFSKLASSNKGTRFLLLLIDISTMTEVLGFWLDSLVPGSWLDSLDSLAEAPRQLGTNRGLTVQE